MSIDKEHASNKTASAAVWIGCPTCYNEGRLIGVWSPAITASGVTTNEIHDAHTCTDNHEELWVFDHEGLPVRGEISPQQAAAWAERLNEVPDHETGAFYAWCLDGDSVVDAASLPIYSEFEDRYCGEWDTFRDYSEHLAEEIDVFANVPEEISRYFDWTSWSRDLAFDYTTVAAENGNVYVFRVM